MTENEGKTVAREPYIDGIYNYCDRWCERCEFTRRCRSFAMEQAILRHAERRERENRVFWEAMRNALGDAMRDVAAKAEELRGEDEEELKAFSRQLRRQEARTRRHPLARLAGEYARAAGRFFDVHEELEGELEEAAQVVRWYQHFIHIKLLRALSWLYVEEEDEEVPDEEVSSDAEGSAKIAIIAMERSMGAWSVIRSRHPRVAVGRMVELARMRAMADRVFPGARAFKRPEFDDLRGE